MSRPGHIVALGGGGFSMEMENPLLDDFILQLAGKRRPRICFVPTPSGDSEGYIERFMTAFGGTRARPGVLRLFTQERRSPARILEPQDIIYVSGGNVANALAVWRLQGVDTLLRRHWEAGLVLGGVSAGMNCWFGGCITDSFGPLRPLRDGLSFLRGSACPHYDGERGRRPAYRAAIAGGFPGGYAADDGAALHFEGGRLVECISSRRSARVYRVQRQGSRVVEEPLPTRYLGA